MARSLDKRPRTRMNSKEPAKFYDELRQQLGIDPELIGAKQPWSFKDADAHARREIEQRRKTAKAEAPS